MNSEVLTPSNPRGKRDVPFELPEVSASEKRRAARIFSLLEERHPDAHCELDYTTPHELLIATILSAQSTDKAVNKATPGLFKAFPAPRDYAAATPKQIEPYIKTIGLFRNKAKHIHGAMTRIVEEFGGEVPRTMDELLSLPGVARKTAGVVLSEAFGIHMGVVVDTHVHRLSQQLGLVPEGTTIPMTERYLMALLPREKWGQISHLLIFHGRRVSPARGYDVEILLDDPVCSRYCTRTADLRKQARNRSD
jgi:endonuclease-3